MAPILLKISHVQDINQLIFSFIQKEGTPQELLELREVMELGILEVILSKVTEKDIEKMAVTYKTGITDRKILSELDLEFHYAFAEATHNPLIIKLFNTVLKMFLPTIEESLRYDIQIKSNLLRGVRFHRKILQAIKSKNLEKVKKAIYESFQVWKETAYH